MNKPEHLKDALAIRINYVGMDRNEIIKMMREYARQLANNSPECPADKDMKIGVDVQLKSAKFDALSKH